jgi:L-ascorbate metabolism protein UlaG (beta-lactamase superfamily)
VAPGDTPVPAESTPVDSALTYVGHATVLVELAGLRLLTDPLLSHGILHVRRRVPVPAVEQLLPLDAILISHGHHDHLDLPSLRRLAGDCPVIVPRGCGALAERAGASVVIELVEGDRLPIGAVVVEAVAAAHDGRRYPVGSEITALGYLLESKSSTAYFAGDTDLFPGMSELAGRVQLAMLPIWGWGSRVGSGHLDPVRAAEAVARIRPALAVPIHWGTLKAWGAQRGLDPVAPARAFADAVGRVAPDTVVRILMPGERTELRT